ncbi:erythromycin esterase [Kitasatospora xanthocidica]|uniref:erythromycin esterase family protein n=1 Tax=Kitasatospora xanthocidica TaxID=83382 RepID=UPI00167437DC|nr:erythromycin esterase family protein [Kitasatospora xanthocidica]GHF67674.1 erythromycin esterase [Kitasatospora xanthocidica]
MSQDIHAFVVPSCELLGLGEPTHQEPAFGWVRNELFARLVDRGFRSIALETDRVAALAVDDYVREGVGTLDTAMAEGFSHGFGAHETNRRLVAWMREFNRNRPPADRLSFHGFDIPTENYSAPSPRRYLEHARDYVRPDRGPGTATGLGAGSDTGLDIAGPAGEDERWSRAEAVLDPVQSPGATAEAGRLRCIADDLSVRLHARAPESIGATSPAEWHRARTWLTAGIGLLRYHAQSAVRGLTPSDRLSGLIGLRDTLMAQNLLDIRDLEARRGPTLVFSHNQHLRRSPSGWAQGELDCGWNSAGRIVGALLGERYAFVAGSLGRSEAIGLGEPASGTHEAFLQRRGTAWELTGAVLPAGGRTRTDTEPRQGYFPLDREVLDGAAALLHIGDGAAVAPAEAAPSA